MIRPIVKDVFFLGQNPVLSVFIQFLLLGTLLMTVIIYDNMLSRGFAMNNNDLLRNRQAIVSLLTAARIEKGISQQTLAEIQTWQRH